MPSTASTRWPSIEGRRLNQQDVHMLVVDRDRARRDLRQATARIAEMVVKFSELAIADIVFKDWYNSLGPAARSKLSLHDLRRMVTMIVRAESSEVKR